MREWNQEEDDGDYAEEQQLSETWLGGAEDVDLGGSGSS